MKFALTGHTSGIGNALYQQLSPNCIGFSRSNGFDISQEKDRRRIIEQSSDCDIFINNAYSYYYQSDLLFELYNSWKDKPRLIINIGSRVADDDCVLDNQNIGLITYQNHKKSLKTLCEDLNNLNKCVSVKYVSFGYVRTERILKKYPNLETGITVDEAVNIILGTADEIL
jgi:hypothetical protein